MYEFPADQFDRIFNKLESLIEQNDLAQAKTYIGELRNLMSKDKGGFDQQTWDYLKLKQRLREIESTMGILQG